MSSTGANSNARVTNARLAEKLDAQKDVLERIENKQDQQGEEIIKLRVEQGRQDERMKSLRNNFVRIQGVITTACIAGFAYLKAQLSN